MCVFLTWFHRRLLLIICVFAMQEKSVCAGVFSGSRERNCALWMKSICSRTSWYSLRIPSPVRNNASSPSRQNTSQTRHATSSGNDLLYRVKILRAGQKKSHERSLLEGSINNSFHSFEEEIFENKILHFEKRYSHFLN